MLPQQGIETTAQTNDSGLLICGGFLRGAASLSEQGRGKHVTQGGVLSSELAPMQDLSAAHWQLS